MYRKLTIQYCDGMPILRNTIHTRHRPAAVINFTLLFKIRVIYTAVLSSSLSQGLSKIITFNDINLPTSYTCHRKFSCFDYAMN